jgi:hypothetical protein
MVFPDAIRYVHIVEAAMHDALTLHQKGDSGSYTGRLSSAKHTVRDAYLPAHLLGQLVQHHRGVDVLSKEMPILQKHFQVHQCRLTLSVCNELLLASVI